MTRWESASPERDSTVPLPFHCQPTPLSCIYRPGHEEFLEAPALAARTCQLARASGIVVAAGRTVAASVLCCARRTSPARACTSTVSVPGTAGRLHTYDCPPRPPPRRTSNRRRPLPPRAKQGTPPGGPQQPLPFPPASAALFAIQQRPHKLPRHHRSHLAPGPPLHDPTKKDQRKPARVSSPLHERLRLPSLHSTPYPSCTGSSRSPRRP